MFQNGLPGFLVAVHTNLMAFILELEDRDRIMKTLVSERAKFRKSMSKCMANQATDSDPNVNTTNDEESYFSLHEPLFGKLAAL